MFDRFLGKNIDEVLTEKPFCSWKTEKWEDVYQHELSTHYLFPEEDVEMVCNDRSVVRTLFFKSCKCDGFIPVINFSFSRHEIFDALGEPNESREAFVDSLFGKLGGWDKFVVNGFSMHVEYFAEGGIKMITVSNNKAE